MSETTQYTDYQRAAMVARFVDILDVSLLSVDAKLLVPRAVMTDAREWLVSQGRKASCYFDEEKKELTVDLVLTATIASAEENALKPTEMCRCIAAFQVSYSFNVQNGPPVEERDVFFAAFANINAVFNVWPYFRELVQTTLGRMGVQPVALPVYRLAPPETAPVAKAQAPKVALRPVEDEPRGNDRVGAAGKHQHAGASKAPAKKVR